MTRETRVHIDQTHVSLCVGRDATDDLAHAGVSIIDDERPCPQAAAKNIKTPDTAHTTGLELQFLCRKYNFGRAQAIARLKFENETDLYTSPMPRVHARLSNNSLHRHGHIVDR